MKQNRVFQTVEDLAQYLISNPHEDRRWNLDSWYSPASDIDAQREIRYYLRHRVNEWSSSIQIELSSELGKQIEDIWTKKPAYKGSTWMRTTGTMTLKGIAKRLGRGDVADLMNKAMRTAEEQHKKMVRNNARSKVLVSAKDLLRQIALLHECAPVHNNLELMTVASIIALVESTIEE